MVHRVTKKSMLGKRHVCTIQSDVEIDCCEKFVFNHNEKVTLSMCNQNKTKRLCYIVFNAMSVMIDIAISHFEFFHFDSLMKSTKMFVCVLYRIVNRINHGSNRIGLDCIGSARFRSEPTMFSSIFIHWNKTNKLFELIISSTSDKLQLFVSKRGKSTISILA